MARARLKAGESLQSRSTRWCGLVTGRALAIARGYQHDWGILLDSGAAFKAVFAESRRLVGLNPEPRPLDD